MDAYDPLETPDADAWLAMDEAERTGLITDYHEREGAGLPDPGLHAAVHAAVENQLAMGDEHAAGALSRLIKDLDRHEAVHAIGSVLTEHLCQQPAPRAQGVRTTRALVD